MKKASISKEDFHEKEPWSDASEEREKFIRRMKKEGKKVNTPRSHELFIDLDSEEQRRVFHRNFRTLLDNVDNLFLEPSATPTIVYNKPSKSGPPRKHIIIYFPLHEGGFSDVERIAWQAALGSDPMRELLSLVRSVKGDAFPTLFVENRK